MAPVDLLRPGPPLALFPLVPFGALCTRRPACPPFPSGAPVAPLPLVASHTDTGVPFRPLIASHALDTLRALCPFRADSTPLALLPL